MTSMQNVPGSQENLGMNKQQQSIPVKSSAAQSGMRHANTYAATLSLVFIACALGGRNLDAQGLIRTQPADVTIKPGEEAVVTLALNSFPQLVQIYRIVPPDSPELFGELLSLDSVWTLPVSERRRYVDESTHGDYVTGKLFTIKEGVIFETTSFNFFICEPSSFGIGECGVTRTFTVFVEEQEELTAKALFPDAAELGDGWWFSNWFGSFNTGFFPWIFHAEHAWMYIWEDSSPDEVYLFDQGSGQWLYTAAETYPNLYSFSRNSWVFYFEGTSGPREFVDLQTSDFFTIP